jgi:chaperone modulatory protein CbpM
VIELDELLLRVGGIERVELETWIDLRWVRPLRRDRRGWLFDEVDVARVELIRELRCGFAFDDEALSLVLGLVDQIYGLRHQMRRLCGALAAQPPDVQAAIGRALVPEGPVTASGSGRGRPVRSRRRSAGRG